MNNESTSRVARAILQYLHNNPDAQDTLAGIAEWWLPKRITTQATTVKEALALLIAVAVLIALWIEPPVTLLVASALYALSGPVLWLRRRRLPHAPA